MADKTSPDVSGDSPSRSGENIADQEGKERGRVDKGTKGASERPVGTSTAHAFSTANAGLLCLFAAVAALAATGIAHLLVVSTPDPLSYLGWIIGLSTAAAVVVPLIGGLPMAAAIAVAVVNLVIGLAIGSLVVGAAAAAYRPTAR